MSSIPKVDWEKFYRWLSGLTVQMPTPVPGAPMDLDLLRDLLIRVQENRSKLDLQSQKIERRLGQLRAELDVLTETRRLEKAQVMQDPGLWHAKSKDYRDSIVEFRLAPISTRIAHTKAMVHQYEAAREATSSTSKTLELAKQTVNSLKQITLAEFESVDDSGAPANTRRNNNAPQGRRLSWQHRDG